MSVIKPYPSYQHPPPHEQYPFTGIDSKLRFSIKPSSAATAASPVQGNHLDPGTKFAEDTTDPSSTGSLDTYNQWRGAMAAVAKLSNGIPPEFRKKVCEYYITYVTLITWPIYSYSYSHIYI